MIQTVLNDINSYVTPVIDVLALIPEPLEPAFQAAAIALSFVQAGEEFAAGNDIGGALSVLGGIAGGLTQVPNLVGQPIAQFGAELSKGVAIAQGLDGVVTGAEQGQVLTAIASALGGVASATQGNQNLTDLNIAAAVGAGLAASGVALTDGDILAAVNALTTAAADPAVGEVLTSSLYMQKASQNACKVTAIETGVPNNATTFTDSNGDTLYLPNTMTFLAEYNAGQANGLNPIDVASNVWQCGVFDFQRSGTTFIPAYTPASNYGVGVYMEAAGYSQFAMDAILGSASLTKSTGAFSTQLYYANLGYNDASKGLIYPTQSSGGGH